MPNKYANLFPAVLEVLQVSKPHRTVQRLCDRPLMLFELLAKYQLHFTIICVMPVKL